MLPFTHDGNSYMTREILAVFVAGRKGIGTEPIANTTSDRCCLGGPRHASNPEAEALTSLPHPGQAAQVFMSPSPPHSSHDRKTVTS